MASTDPPLLHIIVVGFHHKKGCQVEFSYPPLVPGSGEESGEVPLSWKYLPTLALPDGAHNYSKDTVYFHLKNKESASKGTVYGVSCYRQIDAKDIVRKTEDITRGTVQKSVCVLTTLPCFGAIAAKLELVTHAWFEQKDFTQLDLLREAFHSLTASLSSLSAESQVTMGLHLHEVVKLYRHKMLVLFKLILLERKTVFFMTPVSDLCNIILSLLSLFPGLLELGLVESVQNTKTPLVSPTYSTSPHIQSTISNTHEPSSSNDTPEGVEKTLPDVVPCVEPSNDTVSMTTTVSESAPSNAQKQACHTFLSGAGDVEDITPQVHHGKSESVEMRKAGSRSEYSAEVMTTHVPELQLDSEDALLQIDLEDQEGSFWDGKQQTLALADDQSADSDSKRHGRKSLTIDISKSSSVEVVPVVSPTSIAIDKAGMPLAIFTKGSVCHPYLSLSYYDILEDVNIRSFVIGASNVLFKQKRHNIDVLVEKSTARKKDDPGAITIMDKELQKVLQLSTEDLRFADMVCTRVEETIASGEFLENTEWVGGDEWIRAQFKDYLQSLMATVLSEDTHLLEAFNANFVAAWKTTHNYKVWRNTVQQLENIIPGHPCQGGVTLNDMKLQLARSERGRRINAAVDQAGKAVTDTTKAVGGALSNAKTMMSSWWSNIGTAVISPTREQPQAPDKTTE